MHSNIEDKIAVCFTTDRVQYTDFLSPEELADAISCVRDSGLYYFLFGGYDAAERKLMAISASDELPLSPIVTLCGQWDKFGNIGHRDILGAVLATGIERKCIGDIVLNCDKKIFYLFVIDRMADYIKSHMTSVGRCSVCWHDHLPDDFSPEPTFEERVVSVSSARIDCVISAVFNFSRQQSQQIVQFKKVFINHSLVNKTTVLLHENDSVVVRGYGKFIVECFKGFSKKGKQYIKIKLYI